MSNWAEYDNSHFNFFSFPFPLTTRYSRILPLESSLVDMSSTLPSEHLFKNPFHFANSIIRIQTSFSECTLDCIKTQNVLVAVVFCYCGMVHAEVLCLSLGVCKRMLPAKRKRSSVALFCPKILSQKQQIGSALLFHRSHPIINTSNCIHVC